jgi:hypothetical protein
VIGGRYRDDFQRAAMFKELVPGLSLVIGLCVFSALLQTLHVLDVERIVAGAPTPVASGYDCNDLRAMLRPSR